MLSQLVVIVDDCIPNDEILVKLAASLDGARVRTFTDVHAALASCAKKCPDLVIAKDSLCGLDGAEFIHRLRAERSCAGVPVLVIGGPEERELRGRALDAEASDFLPIPLDPREFRARVRNLLQLRQQQRLIEANKKLSREIRSLREERRRRDTLEQRLLGVIDAVPAMIAATDRNGRYIVANGRFAALFGVAPDRLLGKRPDEIRDDAFSRHLMECDARLLAGGALPASFEEEIVDGGGQPRLLLTTKTAFRDGAGETMMVVTAALDVTERRKAERDLIAAKELAEVANHSKTEFLANMSHELRTPLNAIIGFSQLMAGEMLGPMATPKYVDYARDIAASGEHLLGIINDILDVSKLEAGKLDLVEEPIDFEQIFRDLLRLVEEKARAGGVSIETRLQPGLPRLIADSRKVKQILLNLVTNAIKFSHPGGAVEIAVRTRAGAVVIVIADHGIGMDARELQVAVSRFGQVASAWSRKHPGTGLGLPLAIGLTELHGGSLAIRSSKGLGTAVTLTFPRERSERAPDAVAADAAS
ncbi:MAG TPA: ATP-binding protein [Stellaceae bacterium]|nr:ATP-binding protein [Stellaceae bacterium]